MSWWLLFDRGVVLAGLLAQLESLRRLHRKADEHADRDAAERPSPGGTADDQP